MRIISGSAAGKTFLSPRGNKTHPMSEKMRGAIFNMLGDISGMSVLDAYAGSGAIGFEAASRSASEVVLIDNDKSAANAIKQSIKSLGLANIVFSQANSASWAINNTDRQFDLVFCDPPYDHVVDSQLVTLFSCVKVGGLIVFSLPPDHQLHLPSAELLSTKLYGDASLRIYRRVNDGLSTD